MRDVLPDIEKWRARGERVALATVVSMAGSAPRKPGAKLAVSEKGELTGSVSGGLCGTSSRTYSNGSNEKREAPDA